MERIRFNIRLAEADMKRCYGDIMLIKADKEFIECEVSSMGNNFHILSGKHKYGRYICIPNWDVGTELSDLSDVFWNRERLEKYAKLNRLEASSIAFGLAAVASYLNQ